MIVTGLNEETAEEDVQDYFADFGDIRNLSMPLNRRTGYVMVSQDSVSSSSHVVGISSLLRFFLSEHS